MISGSVSRDLILFIITFRLTRPLSTGTRTSPESRPRGSLYPWEQPSTAGRHETRQTYQHHRPQGLNAASRFVDASAA
jgi:hypothetical protein